MALFHCPVCGLPLTDAEARAASCAICGGALTTSPAGAKQPAGASIAAARTGRGRRAARWFGGAGAVSALAVLALLLWHWQANPVERAEDHAPAPEAATIAKGGQAVERAEALPAPKPAATVERAGVAYPADVASAKTPGDATTDGDVGAAVKPSGKPAPVEPPAPKVADQRPVPFPADFPPQMPLMPAFPNPFPAMPGGRRLVDNDIDQLLRMALAQQQELEKLFQQAGLQDLDLLGAAKAFQGLGQMQGLGQLQGFGPRRPRTGPPVGSALAAAGEMVLTGNGITDRDLAVLRDKTSLRALSLAGTAVTDAGLEHLKGLKGLRRLNLSGTRVTDKGLEALHGLTELRELDLTNTRVSDAGSKRLQQALPDVEVSR